MSVFDRIVERNRLFWIAMHGPGTDDERRQALERAFQDDPFDIPVRMDWSKGDGHEHP